MTQQTVLVTGSSGCIGYYLCQRLLEDGFRVIGIDNLSDYHSVQLKRDRQAMLEQHPDFSFVNRGIEELGP